MVKILLVGAGGFAKLYSNYLLKNNRSNFELVGVVEKYFDTCPMKAEIEEAKIPVFATMADFYRDHQADLAVISTPTFLHCEQSIEAVRNHSFVLCEKPASPSPQQVREMMEAEQETGKFIAIAFQWSYSTAIQELKKDILAGKMGKPLHLQTFICWPRDYTYYNRGCGWAGHISWNGQLVLDSIAGNACAHYIHNMLFVLGDSMTTSASPVRAEAECLRVNPIENFDTCILKMVLADGVPLTFYATHASEVNSDPEFLYEFEKASVRFKTSENSEIIATWKDGTVKNYGDPFADSLKKLKDCIACVENGTVPICTAETALPHARTIYDLYQNVAITEFPEELREYHENSVYVRGLYEKIRTAYGRQVFLSDLGAEYAQKVEYLCSED